MKHDIGTVGACKRLSSIVCRAIVRDVGGALKKDRRWGSERAEKGDQRCDLGVSLYSYRPLFRLGGKRQQKGYMHTDEMARFVEVFVTDGVRWGVRWEALRSYRR